MAAADDSRAIYTYPSRRAHTLCGLKPTNDSELRRRWRKSTYYPVQQVTYYPMYPILFEKSRADTYFRRRTRPRRDGPYTKMVLR